MGIKNVIWVIIFSVVILACLFYIHIFTNKEAPLSADIYVSDELLLHVDDISGRDLQKYTAETEYGVNIICWQNNQIWVEQADCSNQVCVNSGRLHSEAMSIICAPHKLVITVHEKEG